MAAKLKSSVIIYNYLIPIGHRFAAIYLFGVIFVKKHVVVSSRLLNHEAIHTAQMRELWFIFFYLIYFIEWLTRLITMKGNFYEAYKSISFERESYKHESDPCYLANRRKFAQWRHAENRLSTQF